MIELQKRAMTGTTLTLNEKDTNSDQEQSFDIVEQLLTKDLDYTMEDDVEEETGKDEQELEEDLNGLEPASLELEEMSAMHEDLTQLQGSPELEVASVLTLPSMATDAETPVRRPVMRRRRSEEGPHLRPQRQAGRSRAEEDSVGCRDGREGRLSALHAQGNPRTAARGARHVQRTDVRGVGRHLLQ